MTIWEQWGHELGSMPLDHWRGNQADETLRAKLAQYFHRELTAAKWAAGNSLASTLRQQKPRL